MKRENFYRRNPDDALSGMVGMSLEERGVYNTVIDLIYLTWRPLEDCRAYIAGHCGCAVQKLNPILARLIARRKLLRFEEDGVWYISNRRFEDERTEVKGSAKTRSGRGEVGEKSGEVGEKSPGVGQNPPLLDTECEEKQPVKPLEKSRVEEIEANASLSLGLVDDNTKSRPPDFEAAWRAYPHVKGRSSKKLSFGFWRRLPVSTRSALPAAVARYAKDGREPRMECGAPAMERWIRDEKFADWLSLADPTARLGEDWSESLWASALSLWRHDGSWDDRLGPTPGQPGCRAPPHLLIEPAAPQRVA